MHAFLHTDIFWTNPPTRSVGEVFPYGSRRGLVGAYCKVGVCHARHGACLDKMEGGLVSHATRLVAILTLVSLCVRVGGRVALALVFLHTLAV